MISYKKLKLLSASDVPSFVPNIDESIQSKRLHQRHPNIFFEKLIAIQGLNGSFDGRNS